MMAMIAMMADRHDGMRTTNINNSVSGIWKEIPSIIANQNLLTLHYQLSINSLIIILSIISNIQLLDVAAS